MEKLKIKSWAQELSQKGISVQLGFQDSTENQDIMNFGEANNQSLFDIASVTKGVMTTYLIMIAQNEGILNIEDTLGKYLKVGSKLESVVIKELLTHKSGLMSWLPLYGLVNNKKEAYDYLLKNNWELASRGERVYSDLGFMILGCLLEDTYSLNLQSLFDEKIKKPLGLKNTFFQNELSIASLATSFGNPFEKKLILDRKIKTLKSINWRDYQIVNEVNDYNCFNVFDGVSGHCGLFSNVEDLLVIANSLMNSQLVSEELSQSFFNEKNLGFISDSNLLKFDLPTGYLGHHGFTGCTFVFHPKTKQSMVFLSNRQIAGLKSENYINWKYQSKV